MPDLEDDPLGAAGWMVTQILKDLQNAKVLPIKIVNMKHQEGLRSSAFMIYLIMIYFQIQRWISKFKAFMSISNSKMDSPGYYMFKTIQCCIGVVNLLGKAIPWSSVPLTWRSAISSWKAFAMFQPRTHHLSSLFIVSYESQVFQNVHGWGILVWSCRVPSVNRAPHPSALPGVTTRTFSGFVPMLEWCHGGASALCWTCIYGWLSLQTEGWTKVPEGKILVQFKGCNQCCCYGFKSLSPNVHDLALCLPWVRSISRNWGPHRWRWEMTMILLTWIEQLRPVCLEFWDMGTDQRGI